MCSASLAVDGNIFPLCSRLLRRSKIEGMEASVKAILTEEKVRVVGCRLPLNLGGISHNVSAVRDARFTPTQNHRKSGPRVDWCVRASPPCAVLGNHGSIRGFSSKFFGDSFPAPSQPSRGSCCEACNECDRCPPLPRAASAFQCALHSRFRDVTRRFWVTNWLFR